MPQSSQPSQSSPENSLKRRQPTIASFFQKPQPQQSRQPQKAEQGQQQQQQQEQKQKQPERNTRVIPEVEDDEDEDDIVAPAPKRARSNKVQPRAAAPAAASDEEEDKDEEQPVKNEQGSQRTDLAQFASSPAVETDTVCRDRKQRSALHEKFVRRLGGPDCLVGIGNGSGGVGDANDAGVEDEMDEDEEPAPAPAKGKGKGTAAKKGGKLTPLEKQVVDIKKKHKDTVLVVEVGYKFRFFGEDARTAAKELSIVCIPGKLRYDERASITQLPEHVVNTPRLTGIWTDPSEAHLDKFASASIPVHRLHVHVKRLITAGHKVGVVRQVETAALKAAGDNRNAPFGRKLTNLYTKGTYIDDVEGLEGPAPAASSTGSGSSSTGHLLCITESSAKGWGNDEKVHVGIVAVQPATGDVVYDDFEDGFMRSEIETRLLHIAPCELLIVGELSKATEKLVRHLSGSKLNVFGDQVRVERMDRSKTAAVEAHSHVSSFYAEKMKNGDAGNARGGGGGGSDGAEASGLLQNVLGLPEQVTVCLSAMITHMTDYGLEHVFELTKYFQHFSARSHMLLNGNTLVSLEIYQNQTDHSSRGSLFWTLDRTHTRFGQRLLRKWVGRPLLDKARLEERVNAVEELTSADRSVSVERIKGLLGKVKSDLERSLIRIYYGKCTRPELLTVLQTMQMLAQEFADIKSPDDAGFASPVISEALASLPKILDDVVFFLNKINMHAAKTDDKYAFFCESEETDEISEQKLGIAGVEHELDEQRTAAGEKLGKKKVDYITVAGIEYLIEVENSSSIIKRVPASWVKVSGTKKVSRFHPPEVIQLLRQRDQHKEALAAACDNAFTSLLAEISSHYQPFRNSVQALATLDCLISLATIASQPGYSKPEYTDSTCIHVEQGRHPMVEQLLLDSYVPNDTSLATEQTRALLVTGPNMGGKSSYVRQVALIAIMGQIGSYVPAQYAKLGMLDAVYTRMGAFDNMLAGESTFMVELSETADVLKQATPRSLVILDELGRGTSTHDGVAIAQAVLDYMVREIRSLTLFITHYQHLANMARSFHAHELRNVHMRFTEEAGKAGGDGDDDAEITFLYEVGEGVAHRSYGLNVARLANLPASLLDLAKSKSAQLEEKIRRKRLAGLVSTVGELTAGQEVDDGVIERLLSRAEEL